MFVPAKQADPLSAIQDRSSLQINLFVNLLHKMRSFNAFRIPFGIHILDTQKLQHAIILTRVEVVAQNIASMRLKILQVYSRLLRFLHNIQEVSFEPANLAEHIMPCESYRGDLQISSDLDLSRCF